MAARPTSTPQPAPDPAAAAELVERIITEGPIGMSAAAKLLGQFRGDRPVHPCTITRWATDGIRLADGSALKLEVVRIGARYTTSRQAVLRFITAQQTQAEAPQPTPAARRGRAAAAGRALERAGI